MPPGCVRGSAAEAIAAATKPPGALISGLGTPVAVGPAPLKKQAPSGVTGLTPP